MDTEPEPNLDNSNPLLEFNIDQLDPLVKISEGLFGTVYKSSLRSNQTNHGIVEVAVKKVKDELDEDQQRSINFELKLLTYLRGHRNVVELIGVVRKSEAELLVLLEYCENGSLDKFFTSKQFYPMDDLLDVEDKSEVITRRHLVSFSQQIADGMKFIHSKRCVHRDLAARNILVADKGKVAKITEFGLARDLCDNSKHQATYGVPIPWAWSAPEYIRTENFYFASDVWSYGVLLWELFNFSVKRPSEKGEKPKSFFEKIEKGWRWSKPDYCDTEIYELMLKCWCLEKSGRPTFLQISTQLKVWLDLHDRKPDNFHPASMSTVNEVQLPDESQSLLSSK